MKRKYNFICQLKKKSKEMNIYFSLEKTMKIAIREFNLTGEKKSINEK